MKKYLLTFLLIPISNFLFPITVYAVCPVCTVAVGAGLGISRALGIDDAVTSVWIGGLVLSMSFWTYDWIGKKKPKFLTTNNLLLTTILMYVLVFVPLAYTKILGLAHNKIFGIDKILFGTLVGSLAFLFGKLADDKVRKIKGKQLFVYQKVIFPVSCLIITSVVLYFLIS